MKKVTLRLRIKSAIFWVIVVSGAFLLNIIALLIFWLPTMPRYKILSSWGYLFVFVAKHLCGIDYQVSGLENLTIKPGIFASNHQSMFETVLFITILPAHMWILKREILYVPFFGWTMKIISPIAINRANRSSSIMQILSQGAKKIKAGFWIMMFPEGTRGYPGQAIKFKTGVGRLALKLNVPIVPIAHNAGYVMPKRSLILYPGTVKVIVGSAIYPDIQDTPESLTRRVEESVSQKLEHLVEH